MPFINWITFCTGVTSAATAEPIRNAPTRML
eukprot:CAMPEP_0204252288 /NCGR_PEP_ID=MMETSP0468-20130131/1074_1 /ASSEMBLY_ACC=CAM_ASM_000383 /TAXON_ID=2969 /ORGANISM="Oxyrrhis marina" /LENGTH=30 /DNA_ID= /DNA_START= /DNA_END= /DNA_ORIENTATION=